MQISSQTLRLALLKLFAEAGAQAADGLAFLEMARSWSATGLRDSDLRVAVHELLESGDLTSEERDDTLCFALSAAARDKLMRPDGELQLANFETEAALFLARYRDRSGYDPMLRRRTEDFLH